ncbi:hypothetical protein GCM10025868_27510 [Angustibacter aerolatus]|uniref:Core-binding (CB) domain-containing protein n=1 Tax=Angustibacter aerolatus TaxID=1162965 RepID=A0ABQ6JL20_9ACTN|nr:hypothetical protein [Angustibacter aerolatus]GMA87501.1 hypothetical protein GCM10025868_27510 [Angustibacter aerolatus]
MSGRLGLGERGEVFYAEQQGQVVAMVYYRDHSGRRRRARATATSKAAARRAATRAVDRALLAGDGYVEPLTVAEAAEQWVAGIEAQVERGTRSPTTLDVYRSALRVHVLPAIGGWRVHEPTPGRLDRFLTTVQAQRGFRLGQNVPHGAVRHLRSAGAPGCVAAEPCS